MLLTPSKLTGVHTCNAVWYWQYWGYYWGGFWSTPTVIVRGPADINYAGCGSWKAVLAWTFILSIAFLLSSFVVSQSHILWRHPLRSLGEPNRVNRELIVSLSIERRKSWPTVLGSLPRRLQLPLQVLHSSSRYGTGTMRKLHSRRLLLRSILFTLRLNSRCVSSFSCIFTVFLIFSIQSATHRVIPPPPVYATLDDIRSPLPSKLRDFALQRYIVHNTVFTATQQLLFCFLVMVLAF